MKRNLTLLVLAGLFVASAPLFAADVTEAANAEPSTEQTQTVDLHVNNPIENAFAKDFATAQATAEINYVSEAYIEAWKAEMANVVDVVRKSVTNKEDIKRVDDYVATYNTLAEKAFELEMLNWISDPDEPIADRSFGTGALGSAMLAQGKIFQQATLNLIAHYQSNCGLAYAFIYNGKGADLEKLRSEY